MERLLSEIEELASGGRRREEECRNKEEKERENENEEDIEEYEEGEGGYREVGERMDWGLEEELRTGNMEGIIREEEECEGGGYLERSGLGYGGEGIELRGMRRGNREESERRLREVR